MIVLFNHSPNVMDMAEGRGTWGLVPMAITLFFSLCVVYWSIRSANRTHS